MAAAAGHLAKEVPVLPSCRLVEESQVKVRANGGVIRPTQVDGLHVDFVVDQRWSQGRAHQDEVLAPGHITLAEGGRGLRLPAEAGAGVSETSASQQFHRVTVRNLMLPR